MNAAIQVREGAAPVEQVIETTEVTDMTDHDETIATTAPAGPGKPRKPGKPRRLPRGKALLTAGALGLLAVGFAGGAAAWSVSSHRPATFDTTLASTPIADLTDSSAVGVKGQVLDVYGNKFVISDGTARALVETGRAGEGGKLVSTGETVTVQGRFDDGFLHAGAIQHADQTVNELDPPPPHRRHGPGEDGPGRP